MKTLCLKSSRTSLSIFWIIVCAISLMSSSSYAATGTNWEDIILSPPPQMDLKQVIQFGLPDLENQMQQTFRDNIDKIKQLSKDFEGKTGIKAGMAYEFTVIDAGGNKVAIECDMLDLAAWDKKSQIPFKFKIEKDKVGAIEISYDPKAPIGIKEIKVEKKMPGGIVSQSGSIAVEGTWEKPEIKINYGQKAATPGETPIKLEAEQSIGLDLSRSADDLYDPEWNPRSEWGIVRGIEEVIAMSTWAVKVTGKNEHKRPDGDKIITSVDVTVGTDQVRNWWTDWLFQDMYDAYDRLDAQLDQQAQWRRDKIEAEAVRLGIKPGEKTNQQLINEIRSVWNANPDLQRPIFRNPGPKVEPNTLTSGSGVRPGNPTPTQPGVTLTPQPTTGTQGGGDKPGSWKNPYKNWKNPYEGWKNPYEGWKNPY